MPGSRHGRSRCSSSGCWCWRRWRRCCCGCGCAAAGWVRFAPAWLHTAAGRQAIQALLLSVIIRIEIVTTAPGSEGIMMWHLLSMTRRRAGPVAGACVLLTGGVGACVLLGAGTAQAAACPGTPVAAGAAGTDTGTLTLPGGSPDLLSPIALT